MKTFNPFDIVDIEQEVFEETVSQSFGHANPFAGLSDQEVEAQGYRISKTTEVVDEFDEEVDPDDEGSYGYQRWSEDHDDYFDDFPLEDDYGEDSRP